MMQQFNALKVVCVYFQHLVRPNQFNKAVESLLS